MPHVDFPQSHCQGAVARRDITPPVGIYHRMWGAATHDRSTGVHRPLLATALVLRPSSSGKTGADQTDIQVIVGIDHCLLWTEEMQVLVAGVCRIAHLEPNQLHITFSHTHAAGLMDPQRANLPGGELIAPYLAVLAERIGEAVCEALQFTRPVRIVYGEGRCSLARNRDFWDEDNGLFVCGLNPDGLSDGTVLVARITDEGNRTIATMVNYACHPTTLAWDNTLISPDFVGAMRELIELATDAPCLFLQGASGDLGPRDGFVGDVAVADRNGRELGYAALAALESLPRPAVRFEYLGPVVSGATIGAWDYASLPEQELRNKRGWQCRQITIDLAYRTDLPTWDETQASLVRWQADEQMALAQGDDANARDCRAQAERMTRQLARLRGLPSGPKVPLVVALWKLGDALWLLLPAEHYNVLQRSLRQRFQGTTLLIATMTGGWLPGYLPAAETYDTGIYQQSIAVVERGSLELVIETIGDHIARLLAT